MHLFTLLLKNITFAFILQGTCVFGYFQQFHFTCLSLYFSLDILILGICQYILSRSNLFSSIQVHEHLIGSFEFKRNQIEMNDHEYDKYKTLYITYTWFKWWAVETHQSVSKHIFSLIEVGFRGNYSINIFDCCHWSKTLSIHEYGRNAKRFE